MRLWSAKKMWVALVLVVLGASLLAGGITVLAVTFYEKNIAGQGMVEFTDQLTVTEVTLVSDSQVDVVLTPNLATVAAQNYTVHLYLDNVDTAQQVVTWTSQELPDAKVASFTSLTLGGVNSFRVEIEH